MLYVEDCLEGAFFLAEAPSRHIDEDRYRSAYYKSLDAMKLKLEMPAVAIQGPPGSGKTYIVERLAEDYIAEEFWKRDDLIFYVAPTNELAYEACKRVLSRILRKLAPGREERCRQLRDIPARVRLLGYKIRSRARRVLTDICKDGINASEMADLTIGEQVRLVFTTEFQRPFIKDLRREIKIVVDESSKSPYFRAFIPLVRRIAEKEFKDYPLALIALGDPQQAITVESYGRDILLMNVMKEKLSQVAPNNYVLLNKTFRLPSPSEVPISEGYYGGKLSAIESGQERLRGYTFNAQTVLRWLSRWEDTSKSDIQQLVNLLEEAINNRIPLVLLNTERFIEGDTLDMRRVKLAYYATLALGVWLAGGRPENSRCLGHEFAVTSIYTDPPLAVEYELGRRGLCIERHTVQSMIGGERDFIVTILGQEYSTDVYEVYSTLYAREPELLNVQLSRHRRLQVVVGCIDCLERFKPRVGRIGDERIATTGKKLKELADSRQAVYGDFKQRRVD